MSKETRVCWIVQYLPLFYPKAVYQVGHVTKLWLIQLCKRGVPQNKWYWDGGLKNVMFNHALGAVRGIGGEGGYMAFSEYYGHVYNLIVQYYIYLKFQKSYCHK